MNRDDVELLLDVGHIVFGKIEPVKCDFWSGIRAIFVDIGSLPLSKLLRLSIIVVIRFDGKIHTFFHVFHVIVVARLNLSGSLRILSNSNQIRTGQQNTHLITNNAQKNEPKLD